MGFNLWNGGVRGDDYRYLDMVIKEQFDVGGTAVLVHKYLGPQDLGDTGDTTQPNYEALGKRNETSIQDLFNLENRDREYSQDVYEMRGIYNVSDADFDLRQFGFFLESDTLFISFHYNDMVAKLGRKIMSGDVFELPHLREFDALDEDSPAFNKFYVVTDASRSSEGYSPTWWSHIWRCKCKPITDSQEYESILKKEDEFTGLPIGDLISTIGKELGIAESIKEEAEALVPQWNFETAHLYVVPGDEDGSQYPWIFAGDGEPPNGAELGGVGHQFPVDAPDGTWFLRDDYEPPVLFRKEGQCWKRKEVDYRRKYVSAHRILESFLNNQKTTNLGGTAFTPGTVVPEKQALSKVVKPKADL